MACPSSRTFCSMSSEGTSTGPVPAIISANTSPSRVRLSPYEAAIPRLSLEETGAALAPRPTSTPAVGAVGPGGGQERHVVVGRGVGDAETNRHTPEKGRVGEPFFREVLADVEHYLVHTAFQLAGAEQRGVGAAVGVGAYLLQKAAPVVRGVEAEELQLEVGGGAAAGGVEDVGGQGHRSQRSLWTVPSIMPYGSSVAQKISFSFSIPNRERSYGMWCLLGKDSRIFSTSGNASSTALPIR